MIFEQLLSFLRNEKDTIKYLYLKVIKEAHTVKVK
jgi:hypothetical protein